MNLLTVKQVAKMLAMSTATVLRWIDSGKLRALKFGTTKQARIRIPDDWLEEDVGYVSASVKRRRPSPEAGKRAYARAQATIDSMRRS